MQDLKKKMADSLQLIFLLTLKKRSNQLNGEELLKQMAYSGILETIKARKMGFPVRLNFGEFLRRYCFLGFSFDERVVATKENCQVC